MARNETISTLNRGFLIASVLLITLVALSTAHAATLAGASLPDQATVGGKTVLLNGLGAAKIAPLSFDELEAAINDLREYR